MDVPAIVLANLCVSYIMTSQNEEAEELMRKIEKEEERLAYTEPDRQCYHLCIVNLVIGTLYCAKGNFEFGISRIIKSLEPYDKKLGPDTWYYSKRCFLALAECWGCRASDVGVGMHAEQMKRLPVCPAGGSCNGIPGRTFHTSWHAGTENAFAGEVGFEFEPVEAFTAVALGRVLDFDHAITGLTAGTYVSLWSVESKAVLARVWVGPDPTQTGSVPALFTIAFKTDSVGGTPARRS